MFIPLFTSGVPYDSSAAAYFAAMGTQESASVKNAIDTFIRGLKSDNLWSVIDGGNILALSTSANARVDFKAPSRVATVTGSPTFTAYRGFSGTGATNELVDTTFVPSTMGVTYLQDSAHIAFYVSNNIQSTLAPFGVSTGSSAYIFPRNTADQSQHRLNDGTTTTIASSTDSRGLFCSSRTGAAAGALYRNGVSLGTRAIASTQRPTGTIKILALNTATASAPHVIAFGCYGGGLNATQAANLNSRVTTLLTALGAN